MRVGTAVGGRYSLLRPLGGSAHSSTYLAYDNTLDRDVVLRVVRLRAPDLIHRIRAAAAFTHAAVTDVLDTGEDGASVYVVTEYCQMGSLADLISRTGPIDPDQVVSIGTRICVALSGAHRSGLLHLGVKPENIVFDSEGRPKLSDLALSAALYRADAGSGDVRDLVCQRYLAPEQACGGETSPATDVYSLGLVLAEAVAGRPVVRVSDRIVSLGMGAYRPSGGSVELGRFESVVRIATSLLPEERFQTADEMCAAIAETSERTEPRQSMRAAHVGAGLPAASPVSVNRRTRPSIDDVFSPAQGAAPSPSGSTFHLRGLEAFPPESEALPLDPLRSSDDHSHFSDGESSLDIGIPEIEMTEVAGSDESESRQAAARLYGPDTTGPATGRPGRRWAIWSTVGVAVCLLLASGSILASPQQAPDVLGRSLDAARNDPRVRVEVVGTEASSGHPAGTVTAQSPAPGEALGFRRPLRVTVSAGPAPVDVPSVIGKPLEVAARQLRGAGVAPVVSQVGFDQSPAGTLVGQDPPGGKAPYGSAVFLTVSAGPPPTEIPDLAGKTQRESEATLRALGFEPRVQLEQSDTVKQGNVIGTLPAAGSRLRPGTTATLVVSKGQPLVTLPDVRNMRVTDASSRLQALGLVVKLVQIVGQDRVVATDPLPGTQVRRGSTVTLTTG